MKWVPYVTVAAGATLLVGSGIVFSRQEDGGAVPVALYFVGLALALAAAIGFGLRQRRGRRALAAVGASLLLVAWVMALGDQMTPLFEVFSDEAYVSDEGPIAVLGLALLAMGAFAGRGSREPVSE